MLAVDDEPDVLDSLQHVFEEMMPDVRLLTATSGADGLRVLDKEPVALAVVDYRMPRMDGLEFVKEATRRKPALRTMLLTAYPDPALARRATQELGVTLVLVKPYDAELLVGSIDYILSELASPPPAGKPG